jgi:hypothetical protein
MMLPADATCPAPMSEAATAARKMSFGRIAFPRAAIDKQNPRVSERK